MTYDDWYDKIGHKIEEELDDWFSKAPRHIDINMCPSNDEFLEDAYNSMESENADRLYDEWKDRDI